MKKLSAEGLAPGLSLAIIAIILLALAFGCSTTPAATPTATAIPSPIPTATPTPPSSPSIKPENASRVKESGRINVSGPLKLVWSLKGDSLAILGQTTVSLFDPNTLQRQVTFEGSARVLDFSSDGHTVAIQSGADQVELDNVTSGKAVTNIKLGVPSVQGLFSPDGAMLALTMQDEIAVTLWDVATGQQLRKLSGFRTAAPVYGIFFAPNGRSLIWRARATVQLMDIATGQLGPIFSHEDFVTALALSPDGKTLATVVPTMVNNQFVGSIKLWDAASGSGTATLTQDDRPAMSITFSNDGRLLAADSGTFIELWDMASHQRLQTLNALSSATDNIDWLAFSPDGAILASTATDGTVRLWRVSP
ncbi:MAG: hypothetical protein A2Y60_07560 [Chloroflexi bacterium RBG_13_54_9]|nr:MAG: hypothetical protein A2Y60_07560 [Chloroflexi bacterium RBG_13_54_9]